MPTPTGPSGFACRAAPTFHRHSERSSQADVPPRCRERLVTTVPAASS
jgi:hypothetical protein